MMKRVLIVTGGTIEEPFAADYVKNNEFELVIAADSGIEFFYRHGWRPDILVGDFDSADEKITAHYRLKKEIEIREFQPEKDDTDTEIAVKLAIERGAQEVHLLGASGSRLDHTMANIALLGLCMEQKIPAYLVNERNRIRLVREETVLKKAQQYGEYVSLLPFAGEVRGLTLAGFKYPVSDFTMETFRSRGISNEITGEEAVISMKSGTLLVVEAKD